MNEWQTALAQGVALIAIHGALCVYLILRRKPTPRRRRTLFFVIGNCILLLVFYVPSELAPPAFRWLFFAGFATGFLGLLLYSKLLRQLDADEAD